ncbi:hypothetical protein DVK02_07585 [Halobellus sp. Atlit-31R]|nr:hypothetical protein DVK02_07585 [Halobellus sp. Atlit-31R]
MMPAPNPTRVVVRRPMNDHGAMTVEVCATNETRHLSEYASPELRRRLEALPSGTTVPLTMARVGVRANVWRALDLPRRREAATPTADPDRPPRTIH